MRIVVCGIVSALVLVIATAAAHTAVAEIIYPWCRQPAEGGNNCGFSSFEQCMGSGLGAGVFCIENPRYQLPAKATTPKRRR
jgi:hypothetical protein